MNGGTACGFAGMIDTFDPVRVRKIYRRKIFAQSILHLAVQEHPAYIEI
ncbi:hypothetical protein [Paenibacillus pabuli]|nr:hypothetical protein [Paenibacillus pabuli]UPK46473.1 hypothetical protein KET34_14000 [Paenibacillus pabuli]